MSGTYIDVSNDLRYLMELSAANIASATDLWGQKQARRFKVLDNIAWFEGGCWHNELIVTNSCNIYLSSQYRVIHRNELICSINLLDLPIINKIKKYDQKKKLIITNSNHTIHMSDIVMLIEYLRCEDINEAARQLCRARVSVQTAIKKLSVKLGYIGPREMKTEVLSNLLVPTLKKLTEL